MDHVLSRISKKLTAAESLCLEAPFTFDEIQQAAFQLPPSSLVATLLKAWYYPHSTFLDSGKGHCPSLIWNNISWGKALFLLGLRKTVGNGTSISIFKDAWIQDYKKLTYLSIPNTLNRNVSSLIIANGEWDVPQIQSIFPNNVWQAIQSIPLLHPLAQD
uniref:Uncharacterized protein n=1 Tax=Cannabis sativa TaxID=3483 RepID=A0A803P3Z8_CANSA